MWQVKKKQKRGEACNRLHQHIGRDADCSLNPKWIMYNTRDSPVASRSKNCGKSYHSRKNRHHRKSLVFALNEISCRRSLITSDCTITIYWWIVYWCSSIHLHSRWRCAFFLLIQFNSIVSNAHKWVTFSLQLNRLMSNISLCIHQIKRIFNWFEFASIVVFVRSLD